MKMRGSCQTCAKGLLSGTYHMLCCDHVYCVCQDGKLSITEAVNLLNGPEISGAIKQATGMEHSKRSEADIKKW